MATPQIKSAVAQIPTKLAALKKSHETLQSFSSALLSFNLQWSDLESHFANLQKSIDHQLRLLESKPLNPVTDSTKNPVTKLKKDNQVSPRPELLSLCLSMDAAALRAYIVENIHDVLNIRNELAEALAAAPDPGRLVVDVLEGEEGSQVGKRCCLNFLEQLRGLGEVAISEEVRERARRVGEEWLRRIVKEGEVGENGIEALAFLELLGAFRLMGEFDVGDVLDVFVLVSRRKQAVEHCRSLGLGEHMPDLIVKLSNKGRLLDAVKFIHHLNLADKFPLVPLLKEYLKDARKTVQDIREKGNSSKQAMNEATAKELSVLKAAVKAVEDYHLQSQYSCDELNKRIAQLEQKKANKKRPAPAAAAIGSHTKKAHRQHSQQPLNKRSRPMASMTSSQYTVASHQPPPLAHSHIQSQLGLIEQPQYQGLHYGLTRTGAPYDAAVPIITGAHYALGRNQSPPHPRSHLYSSESLLGTGAYDMPAAYGNYVPSSSSLYPRGI